MRLAIIWNGSVLTSRERVVGVGESWMHEEGP